MLNWTAINQWAAAGEQCPAKEEKGVNRSHGEDDHATEGFFQEPKLAYVSSTSDSVVAPLATCPSKGIGYRGFI